MRRHRSHRQRIPRRRWLRRHQRARRVGHEQPRDHEARRHQDERRTSSSSTLEKDVAVLYVPGYNVVRASPSDLRSAVVRKAL
jgi:hypothetical protein